MSGVPINYNPGLTEEVVYPPCQPHLKEKSKIKIQKKSTREEFFTHQAHTTHHPPPPREAAPPHTLTQPGSQGSTHITTNIGLLLTTHLQAHTYLYPKLKISRDFSKPLKKFVMNNLFNLLLTLMCGVSCIEAITAESTEAFVLASTAMCISAICFLINASYPLFKK